MKLYSEYAGASMSMTASQKLRHLLEDIFRQEKITHVLETGTYRGLGSTTFVSEAFPESCRPQIFVTIEVNWFSWYEAKRNLRRFPFVMPLWGRTVAVDRALQFIENDDMLRNHTEYPEIFIDDTRDPIQFYHNEILGLLGGSTRNPKYLLHQIIDRVFSYAGNNLLEKYLRDFCFTNPLIILDSAGGVGFLEFSIVEQMMRTYPYFLLLDDINHIKHFRSYQHIESDCQFQILQADEDEGWLFAKHTQ